MSSYVYLRGLRHVDHTVFCVEKGQKTYYDQTFERTVAYSSGQQVKRSVLESILGGLGERQAPITFFWDISKKGNLEQGEAYSPCDPEYTEQLLGGWMMAKSKKKKTPKQEKKPRSKSKGDEAEETNEEEASVTIKRRSPLSISAMRPLHPLLASVTSEDITFDRSNNPDYHTVTVRDTNGSVLTAEQVQQFLISSEHIPLSPRKWIPAQKEGSNRRTAGLFVFDAAIDMRTLFCVSLNDVEPELETKTVERLKSKGWKESTNAFGACLVCPKKQREKIIPALAHGLINWRITSNQSRTFSLMETLSVAVSDNANEIAGAIRATLNEEKERSAKPVIDSSAGAAIYIALPCDGYIVGAHGSADALAKAEEDIVRRLHEFDYEKQA